MKRVLAALAFAVLAVADAGAELILESVSWQRARVQKARVVAWEDVGRLSDGPPKLDTRLRARLTLKNRGPVAAEAILLRYSLAGRIAPVGDSSFDGVWGVPFSLAEKRVPRVGPNKTYDVFLMTSPALELYLNKLARAGWWLNRVKLQVMLEPHRGVVAVWPLERELEVEK